MRRWDYWAFTVYQSKDKELYYCLPYKKPKRRKRFARQKNPCRYGKIRLITQRPEDVATRKRFGHWEGDTIEFKGRVYYCETHSPWQKGSNENMNGRLRWYLPRESNIAKITQAELDELAAKMNRCPRKCLGYKTPQEVFIQQHKNDCRIWS